LIFFYLVNFFKNFNFYFTSKKMWKSSLALKNLLFSLRLCVTKLITEHLSHNHIIIHNNLILNCSLIFNFFNERSLSSQKWNFFISFFSSCCCCFFFDCEWILKIKFKYKKGCGVKQGIGIEMSWKNCNLATCILYFVKLIFFCSFIVIFKTLALPLCDLCF